MHPDFDGNMGNMEGKNKNTINNQDVAPQETKALLKELIQDMMRKSWNATCFMEAPKNCQKKGTQNPTPDHDQP